MAGVIRLMGNVRPPSQERPIRMRSTLETHDGPMAGLRILDLTDHRASYCGKLVADLGAEVIKTDWNCVDNPAAILPLMDTVDAIFENGPVGYLQERGLTFPAIASRNPRVILVSVTSFGQTGPRAHWKGDDLIIAALGGQMSICGAPEGPPQRPAGDQTYVASSLYAVIGLLIALAKRHRTGKGGHVDISALEATASMLDQVLVRYIYEQVISKRTGNAQPHRLGAILPCRDGHIQIDVSGQWETLVEWMQSDGMAEDLSDHSWTSESYRREHFGHIVEVLTRWTRSYSADVLFELAQAMRFPWAPVLPPAGVVASPQLKERGYFATDKDGRIMTGPSYRISSSPISRSGADVVARKGGNASGGVLAGVRVLDFTWVLAGPYATRILADFGAEVIKVQSGKTSNGSESNLAGYFNAWNRNKRSITLDMSFPEARKIALDLAASCDVVVENFSPRVLRNWGLTYDEFKNVNAQIIMASISAMGQTGPWRDYVAYGPTLQALSGLSYCTTDAKGQPLGVGFAYGDHVIGLNAAVAILAALEQRTKTGRGAYIDLSGYEAVCNTMASSLVSAMARIEQLDAGETGVVNDVYSSCYPCLGENRWVAISVASDNEWKALCQITGNFDWLSDMRYATSLHRRERKVELDAAITRWTRCYAPEYIAVLLQNAGVAAGTVQDARDIMCDPQLTAREFFSTLDHRLLGRHETDRSPVRFATDGHPNEWKSAPEFGADNSYVFEHLLGLSADLLADYRHRKIIA